MKSVALAIALSLSASAASIDDASRMNATDVAKIVDVHAESDVSAALAEARRSGRSVSIAGRRHSMGRQTFRAGGIVLNMLPFNGVSYDQATTLVHVQTGATWAQVQHVLDPVGRSVEVMQSDTIFTVGGSLSVNVHGWQPNRPPLVSTVEDFRLVLASGDIKTCSRTQNTDLFRAALGGYGLMGVILDVRLRTVPNRRVRYHTAYFPADEFPKRFQERVRDRDEVELAYGRLSIDRDHRLTEAALHTYVAEKTAPGSMSGESMVWAKRKVFADSARGESQKRRRWRLEKELSLHTDGGVTTRNTVMNPDATIAWTEPRDGRHIIQEYFVPYEAWSPFLKTLRAAVLDTGVNLLNVTIRDVRRDTETLLPYARRDSCALVLFLLEPATPAGEAAMRRFTETVTEGALAQGGSFYLPYRPHYRLNQFEAAYPGWPAFLKLKHQMDPQGLFSSGFYDWLQSAHGK